MFKWLNKIFNYNAEALPIETKSFDAGEILTGIPAPKEKPAKKHTKASLTKLTKVQLEELGLAEFDIELDRRKKKDTLVAELLAAQKSKK